MNKYILIGICLLGGVLLHGCDDSTIPIREKTAYSSGTIQPTITKNGRIAIRWCSPLV
jgi:hypothetical protein